MIERDVAIVGMGIRYPDASSPRQLWDNILDRKVSFRPIAGRWDHSLFYRAGRADTRGTTCHMSAWLDDVERFAAEHFRISPRRAQCMDPQQRVMLEIVREALADAGLETRPYCHERSGVFVGASVSEYSRIMVGPTRARQMGAGEFGAPSADAEDLTRRVAPGGTYTMAGSLLSMCASEVAQSFDLRGPVMAVDAACASSLVAVVQGVTYLRGLAPRTGPDEAAPIVVAGGVYLNLLPDNFIAFGRTGALAQGACRPFDEKAEGFLIGEGAGVVVLKRLADALADGDRVYAVLRGVGWCADGPGESPMTPARDGQERAIRQALADGGIDPSTVGYVECHGTGTVVGDALELGSVHALLGSGPFIGSVKANFGHLLTAAGVAGLMRAALAVYHATVPPQAAWERWHPRLGPATEALRIATEPLPWEDPQRRAVVNAFGFGGINCVAVLEQAPAVAAGDESVAPYPLCCSAATPALLAEHLRALRPCLADGADYPAIAYTLTAARRHGAYGCALLARDAAEARQRVDDLLEALREPPGELTRSSESTLLGPCPDASLLVAALLGREGASWSDVFPRETRRIADVPVVGLPREPYWIVGPPA